MNPITLRWTPSPLLHTLATLVFVGLATSALLHSPAALAIVAPELLWLASFAHPDLPRAVDVHADCWPRHCQEGDEVTVLLEARLDSQELHLDAECNHGDARLDSSGTDAGLHHWRWLLPAPLWGTRPLCRGSLRLTSHGGLWVARLDVIWPMVEVWPGTSELWDTVRSPRVRPWAGSRPARATGSGLEAVGVSPYAPGMPVRRLNWRRTLQRGEWFMTDFAVERSQDVVVVVDGTVDAGPAGESTVDRAVRGAATIASAHVGVGDRVGLVTISPAIDWVTPGSGRRHLMRVLHSLIRLRERDSVVPPDLDRLPPAVVPHGSLVVLLSPLLSEQSVSIAGDLRRRGHPVLLVDVSPEDPIVDHDTPLSRSAVRLWRLERQATLLALQDRGVRVLSWPPCSDLAEEMAWQLRGDGRREVVA